MERPADLPRLFADDPRALAALDHLVSNPQEIRDHLLIAGGGMQAREMYGAAAACLLAAHNADLWVKR